MLNLPLIARAGGRLPGRSEDLVEHFRETRIARIASMKLNQSRGALLVEQEVTDMIGNCLGRCECVKVRRRANAKIFARARVTRRTRRNQTQQRFRES